MEHSTVCFSVSFISNRGLAKQQNVLLTHGDSIDKLAKGFTQAANSGKLIAGICPQCRSILNSCKHEFNSGGNGCGSFCSVWVICSLLSDLFQGYSSMPLFYLAHKVCLLSE